MIILNGINGVSQCAPPAVSILRRSPHKGTPPLLILQSAFLLIYLSYAWISTIDSITIGESAVDDFIWNISHSTSGNWLKESSGEILLCTVPPGQHGLDHQAQLSSTIVQTCVWIVLFYQFEKKVRWEAARDRRIQNGRMKRETNSFANHARRPLQLFQSCEPNSSPLDRGIRMPPPKRMNQTSRVRLRDCIQNVPIPA